LLTYVAAHAGSGVGRYDDALVEDEGERGRAPLVLHHVLGRRLEPVELLERKKERQTHQKSERKRISQIPAREGDSPRVRRSRRRSGGSVSHVGAVRELHGWHAGAIDVEEEAAVFAGGGAELGLEGRHVQLHHWIE
jgi:hypothetical protein